MDDKQIDFALYILGFVGLLVLLGGAFSFYEFKYGLVGAIIIWFIAGAYRKYFGVPNN
ncbi:hypothetical protein [Methanobacterium alcaliphilum]|uniref:hypothetical protein n=1 Tax=Methanobacterium alcaliphilum TaxID=392018 RepID=UPI00200B20AE|nr:hypothetical protein [Methanobacterium alcaliphilum]MCK9152205.1 hypothetical protein [Methanobacterium alcaliphilum]